MTKRFAKFGKFTFSAHESGQHFFCFQTNSTRFSVFAGEKLVRTEEKSDLAQGSEEKNLYVVSSAMFRDSTWTFRWENTQWITTLIKPRAAWRTWRAASRTSEVR